MQLIDIFRALGDDTRLRMLNLISQETLCVCQISETLRISQPNASKHLARLCSAGIIECSKISQWCFYGFSENFINKYPLLHSFLLISSPKNPYFQKDLKTLLSVKESGVCCKEILD